MGIAMIFVWRNETFFFNFKFLFEFKVKLSSFFFNLFTVVDIEFFFELLIEMSKTRKCSIL